MVSAHLLSGSSEQVQKLLSSCLASAQARDETREILSICIHLLRG